MRAWSDRPFEPVTELAEVAAAGARIAGENGQSTAVYESADHPGWLVKRYKPGFPEEPPDVLDRLIALPGAMTPADLAVVDAATCWPVSRVVSDGVTVGVVVAKAPAEFFTTVRTPFGPPESVPLNLDQLVQTDDEFYKVRELAVPGGRERRSVARSVLRVGALLERHDVVYGDWSYANLFWERGAGRVFLIDMDSCGLSSRAWVECNSWNDPAVPQGERLTVRTDRYKVAVAVLRVLTGVRGEDAHPALDALDAPLRASTFGEALRCSLDDPPELRPSSGELLELLETELDPRPASRPAKPPAARPAEPAATRPVPTARGAPPPAPAKPAAPAPAPAAPPVPAPAAAPTPATPPPPAPASAPASTPTPAAASTPARKPAPARSRTPAPPRVEYDPFERDPSARTGVERLVPFLIICCLGALVLLLLGGVVSALLP
ncbi:hypothetical protein [Actinomadura decatromicini]|uniref:Protein kinase domain-containing protein n=1 Tax=Actinomadura decatromicini TaxID=2604572 RepID=A0A5D3FW26_9ACTN|nr:hypothetical protein [Actinomadura decatromicini]TYK52521.1 hypothetical protein FXF68_01735 [Actinomadura decatromicini]